jgi:hypothetical protein
LHRCHGERQALFQLLDQRPTAFYRCSLFLDPFVGHSSPIGLHGNFPLNTTIRMSQISREHHVSQNVGGFLCLAIWGEREPVGVGRAKQQILRSSGYARNQSSAGCCAILGPYVRHRGRNTLTEELEFLCLQAAQSAHTVQWLRTRRAGGVSRRLASIEWPGWAQQASRRRQSPAERQSASRADHTRRVTQNRPATLAGYRRYRWGPSGGP